MDRISVGIDFLLGMIPVMSFSTLSGNEGCESDCSCDWFLVKEMGAMAPPDVNDMILEGDAGEFPPCFDSGWPFVASEEIIYPSQPCIASFSHSLLRVSQNSHCFRMTHLFVAFCRWNTHEILSNGSNVEPWAQACAKTRPIGLYTSQCFGWTWPAIRRNERCCSNCSNGMFLDPK